MPVISRPSGQEPEDTVPPPVVETPVVDVSDAGTITGTVRSTRGVALRGIRVQVIDAESGSVATTTTGTDGTYVVEDVPAGRHRVAVSDEDGRHVPAWLGGTTYEDASIVKVKAGRTRRTDDILAVSAALLEVTADAGRKKVKIGIRVTEAGTGVPAEGHVTVTTSLFSTRLPLVDGRSRITLLGAKGGATTLPASVEVVYSGAAHTAPTSRSVEPAQAASR